MTFDDLLSQILALLQHEKRISYRALKRRFHLADEDLEDLKEELIYAKQWAMDEAGRVLVWIGDPALATPPGGAEQARSPLAYTPKHLAEKILTTRGALEGERKQVTVLFADVAGFSTLSARLDPEDVHTIMDGCFEILTQQVHRYEGTINQYTGDGIMALFGAPITHEDHAVRACYAALGIQTALRDYGEAVQRRWGVSFQMRLGLNTGVVVVGRIGDDLRMDYTAQGDTVNRAAHLQQMASPGATWAAEATYGPAGAAFEWQALGPLPVKGSTDPVAVYALCGRHASRSRFDAVTRRGLTRFVGRDLELERLRDAWGQAQQGHGQVVSVVGEVGLGKSRLLYEFKQQLARQQARYIEGTCFTYGDSISYLPFLDIVRALCALEEGAPEAEAKRRIGDHLATLEVEASIIVPSLHHLLSFTVDDPLFLQLPPELVRQRTVEALTTLVMAEARHRPLVMILEDVHWIDKATEEVVEHPGQRDDRGAAPAGPGLPARVPACVGGQGPSCPDRPLTAPQCQQGGDGARRADQALCLPDGPRAAVTRTQHGAHPGYPGDRDASAGVRGSHCHQERGQSPLCRGTDPVTGGKWRPASGERGSTSCPPPRRPWSCRRPYRACC